MRISIRTTVGSKRAGFRMLLAGEEDIEVVAEASNGLEAIDKAARTIDWSSATRTRIIVIRR